VENGVGTIVAGWVGLDSVHGPRDQYYMCIVAVHFMDCVYVRMPTQVENGGIHVG
jgi:hypothetical protein